MLTAFILTIFHMGTYKLTASLARREGPKPYFIRPLFYNICCMQQGNVPWQRSWGCSQPCFTVGMAKAGLAWRTSGPLLHLLGPAELHWPEQPQDDLYRGSRLCSVPGVHGSAMCWMNKWQVYPLDTMERWCGLGKSFVVSNAFFSPLPLLTLHIN